MSYIWNDEFYYILINIIFTFWKEIKSGIRNYKKIALSNENDQLIINKREIIKKNNIQKQRANNPGWFNKRRKRNIQHHITFTLNNWSQFINKKKYCNEKDKEENRNTLWE